MLDDFLLLYSEVALPYEPYHSKTCHRVSNQVRHKPSCTTTENSKKLTISGLGVKGLYNLRTAPLFLHMQKNNNRFSIVRLTHVLTSSRETLIFAIANMKGTGKLSCPRSRIFAFVVRCLHVDGVMALVSIIRKFKPSRQIR